MKNQHIRRQTGADDAEAYIEKRLGELKAEFGNLEVSKRAEELLKQIEDGEIADRCEAAMKLGRLGERPVIYPLAQAYYAHRRSEEYVFYSQPHELQAALALALSSLGEFHEISHFISSESGYPKKYTVDALLAVEGAADAM